MKKQFVLGIMLLLAGCFDLYAAENNPTVVFGAAATPDGEQNTFVVEQPEGAPNPLGDPIAGSNTPPQVFDVPAEMSNQVQSSSDQSIPQPIEDPNALNEQNMVEPSVSNNPTAEAQSLGEDFQNTLTEANGRIYDIQSYPEQDVNVMGNSSEPQTIYSPNVNN